MHLRSHETQKTNQLPRLDRAKLDGFLSSNFWYLLKVLGKKMLTPQTTLFAIAPRAGSLLYAADRAQVYTGGAAKNYGDIWKYFFRV